jgi:excisionase family DNA binding protein
MNQDVILSVALKAVQLYADLHPRPAQVTQTQAAEMLGLSRATVCRMVQTGHISLNKCGLISIAEIDRLLQSPKNSP